VTDPRVLHHVVNDSVAVFVLEAFLSVIELFEFSFPAIFILHAVVDLLLEFPDFVPVLCLELFLLPFADFGSSVHDQGLEGVFHLLGLLVVGFHVAIDALSFALFGAVFFQPVFVGLIGRLLCELFAPLSLFGRLFVSLFGLLALFGRLFALLAPAPLSLTGRLLCELFGVDLSNVLLDVDSEVFLELFRYVLFDFLAFAWVFLAQFFCFVIMVHEVLAFA